MKKSKKCIEDKENEGRKSSMIQEEGRSEFQSLTNSKSKRRRASYNKFEVVKTANSVEKSKRLFDWWVYNFVLW